MGTYNIIYKNLVVIKPPRFFCTIFARKVNKASLATADIQNDFIF